MGIVYRDYSYGNRGLEDAKRNLPTLIMIMIPLFLIIWMSWNEVKAGTVYLAMFLSGIAGLVLFWFFTKSTDELYEIPIGERVYDALTFYIIGSLIPFLLFYVPKLFGKMSIVTAKVFAPLTFSGVGGLQTFAVLSVQKDAFWNAATIVDIAGTVEPFIIGFVAVSFGIIFGRVIRLLLGRLPNGLTFGEEGDRWFDFIIGMIFSIVVFVLIHKMNASYVGIMFLWAGVFRFIGTLSMYFFNLGLVFWIGFHKMTNAVAYGLWDVVTGYASHPIGIFLILFNLLIIFSFIINTAYKPEWFTGVFKRIWDEVGL